MQVSDPNNIKIYNLSAGKSLPEWLSERKRRSLLKKNIDIRRRIELIQDFDMPGVSSTIRVSNDGQYVLATGIYKPRVKCFDVNNLSLKFERCFDSEAVTFEILSDDYSKLVFLQCDRYVEFHAAHGRYFRLRIPKFGRDMKYHHASCDLYIVGASSDVYRLNLERGQFMTPLQSQATSVNRCTMNEVHNLVLCGTHEGRVEAWDPRSKHMAGSLDCAFSCVNENKQLEGFPSISALKSNGALQLGVGTTTGQVLLYDIRSDKPFYVKDHMYGQPIKDVDFHYQQDLVYSLDASVLKIWHKNDGKWFTSIEASVEHNNLCIVPNSGLLFIANENTKMQTYYIPSLGPAPKWACFLDNLTEELEESNAEITYDDYKFVTQSELENLGLDHLIGTNLLRAYMHGYFMDVRLFRKAKSVTNPFEFDEFRKRKIRETIDAERANRVQINKLPKVNKDLALKLMNDKLIANTEKKGKKVKNNGSLLDDDRFGDLFKNPDFEVDKNADEYRLLNPVLSRLDVAKKKAVEKKIEQNFELVEEIEGKNSSEESSGDESADAVDSSDDEHTWTKDVKKQYRQIQREHKAREWEERRANAIASANDDADVDEAVETQRKQPKMFALRQGEEFKGVQHMKKRASKATLGERLVADDNNAQRVISSAGNNREMTFSTGKTKRDRQMEMRNEKHREERKKLVRPTFGMGSKPRTKFFKRK